MPSLQSSLDSNLSWGSNLRYEPIAVFVGGTSGVGEAMLESLHRYTNGHVHIIIVGRNKVAADATFTRLREGKGHPNGGTASVSDSQLEKAAEFDGEWKREFIYADVSLTKSARELCTKLLSTLPRLNFLILSAGYGDTSNNRRTTSEGLAEMISMRYYSRFRLIQDLLPLLRAARDAGQEAKATSIMSTMQYLHWANPNPEDFGMERKYVGLWAGLHTMVYNDYMMEEYSIREPGITFTHATCGFVDTPANNFIFEHWISKYFIGWLLKKLITRPEDCATWMWYGTLEGNGFNRRTGHGDFLGSDGYAGKAEIRTKLYDHSVRVTDL